MKLIRQSWFGNLNFWLLQLFFIRLAKVYDNPDPLGKFTGWKFIGFIVPFTGWSSDYIYIKKMNWGVFKKVK